MALKRLFCIVVLLCGALFSAQAQQALVRGQVTDENGDPLVGVSVVVKNTMRGVSTDVAGSYSIQADKGDVLVFSYVGKQRLEAAVGTRSKLDVQLAPQTDIDEVVVVGYGVVKKSDLTGSVSSIKNNDLMKSIPTSVEQGMQGRLAGVHITRNDGAPGGGISMQIRGTNSFMGGTEPLYVIDGVPMSTSNSQETVVFDSDKDVFSRNALAFLNPEDIESIEVLKDASSVAIYGSQGANGVVMITTKSGKSGRDKLNVSLSMTVSSVAKKLRVLGAREYALYRNESYINTQTIDQGSYDPLRLPFPGAVNDEGIYEEGPDDFKNDPYYWQDIIFRTVVSENASVSYSGASKGFDYAVSGSFVDQKGTVINSGYQRTTFKVNLNKEIKPWLKMGTSTNFSTSTSKMLKTATQNQNNGDEGVIRSALYFPPTYLEDTDITLGEFSTVTNPKQYAEAYNRNVNYNLYTSNYANFTLAKGLIFRTVLGFNFSTNQANRYFPRTTSEGRPVNGQSQAGDNTWQSLLWDNLLMYNRSFGKHNVNGTLGTSWQSSSYYNKMIVTEGFGTDANNGLILSDGTNPRIPRSSKGDAKMWSYILRAAYNYDSRYFATFTLRRDASSKFAVNHKAAYFPSVGVAWRVSGENFLKDSKAISNLKLRYSYGTAGNAAIGSYGSLALMTGANYPFGNGVQSGYAPDPNNPGNPALKWETTHQHDIGLDLTLFKELEVTVDYYDKLTTDLIQYKEQPASTGVVHILSNIGEVRNKGIEVALNATIMNRKNFTWRAGFNIARNKNSVTNAGESMIFPNKLWNDLRPFVITKGKPIGQLYGYIEDGIWNSREEIINSKQFQTVYPNYKLEDNDPATEKIIQQKWLGEVRYKDRDDSGTITESDRDFIGDVNPSFTYGFNMDFTIRNFDFSFLFDGVHGNDILNMSSLRNYNIGGSRNTLKAIYDDAWSAKTGGNSPKNYYDSSRKMLFSRRFIEDGSYLKLRNISLGYTLNNVCKGISSLRIYFSANNLFTITDYTGFDPEVNSFGSDPSLRGVDAGGYPQSREFTFGVNLTF